jgi:hypothetical protein
MLRQMPDKWVGPDLQRDCIGSDIYADMSLGLLLMLGPVPTARQGPEG